MKRILSWISIILLVSLTIITLLVLQALNADLTPVDLFLKYWPLYVGTTIILVVVSLRVLMPRAIMWAFKNRMMKR